MKIDQKHRRQRRVRAGIKGTQHRPRATVFRSSRAISVQLINDELGHTLLGVHSQQLPADKAKKHISKTERAVQVGQAVAKKASELGITEVVFDRGSYRYYGRVKAVAAAMREGGLKF